MTPYSGAAYLSPLGEIRFRVRRERTRLMTAISMRNERLSLYKYVNVLIKELIVI